MTYRWKPLEESYIDPADYLSPKYRVFAEAGAEQWQCSIEEAAERLANYDAACKYYRNDLYQVQVRPFHNEAWDVDMIHLNIRRIDGAAIFDWRHRQLIKNQLVGEECEAFEVYPAESRLVDETNKYHLWVFVDPKVRIPVEAGTGQRSVIEDEVKSPPGARQRRVI